MIRVNTMHNIGDMQVGRMVEVAVEDILALSIEERIQFMDMVTAPVSTDNTAAEYPLEWDEATAASDIPKMSGELLPIQPAAHSSHTQNLVEHGLFEKDFMIKHKLDMLRILQGADNFLEQQEQIVKSLMHDLEIFGHCGVNTSKSG